MKNAFIICYILLLGNVRGENHKYKFPKSFKFGVALSSVHTLGNDVENEYSGSPRDDSCYPNEDYKEQIENAADLGVHVFTFTLSWEWILPTGLSNIVNTDAVLQYRRLLEEIYRRKLIPIAVMSDFQLPKSLQNVGGWINPEIARYFEDYARVLFSVFGDLIKHWITFDNPYHVCANIFFQYQCGHNIILAHAKSYRMYEKHFRSIQYGSLGVIIGTTYQIKEGSHVDNEQIVTMSKKERGLYTHPILSSEGNYPSALRESVDELSLMQGFSRSLLPSFTPEEVLLVKGSADFIGLKASQFSATATDNYNHEDLRNEIKWITNEYDRSIPLLILGNAAQDEEDLEDYDRIGFVKSQLEQVLLSLYEDGSNVVGYVASSLADSCDWRTKTITKRHGFYKIDLSFGTIKTTPKLSAKCYKNIIERRFINRDFLKRPKSLFD